jgi:hypothetical protein
MKKRKKYSLGGIASKVSDLFGGNEEITSALTSAAMNQVGKLINTIGESKTPEPYPVDVGQDTNPYMALGGNVGENAQVYQGKTHEEGGVPLNSEGKVVPEKNAKIEGEGDELNYTFKNGESYIFSKRLGVAPEVENLLKKVRKKSKTPDSMFDLNLQDLIAKDGKEVNETLKKEVTRQKGEPQQMQQQQMQQAALGGNPAQFAMGGDPTDPTDPKLTVNKSKPILSQILGKKDPSGKQYLPYDSSGNPIKVSEFENLSFEKQEESFKNFIDRFNKDYPAKHLAEGTITEKIINPTNASIKETITTPDQVIKTPTKMGEKWTDNPDYLEEYKNIKPGETTSFGILKDNKPGAITPEMNYTPGSETIIPGSTTTKTYNKEYVPSLKKMAYGGSVDLPKFENGNNPEEIKRMQQILVDAGIDIGTTGPNKDGIDGFKGKLTDDGKAEFVENDSTDYSDTTEFAPGYSKRLYDQSKLALKPISMYKQENLYNLSPEDIGVPKPESFNTVDSKYKLDMNKVLTGAALLSDAKDALRAAEVESPIYTDYSKVNEELGHLNSNSTAAQQENQSGLNKALNQIRGGSSSFAQQSNRAQSAINQAAKRGQDIAATERQARNNISLNKASSALNQALERASTQRSNKENNQQNLAAKGNAKERFVDDLFQAANQINEKDIAAMDTKEGMARIRLMNSLFSDLSDEQLKEVMALVKGDKPSKSKETKTA